MLFTNMTMVVKGIGIVQCSCHLILFESHLAFDLLDNIDI